MNPANRAYFVSSDCRDSPVEKPSAAAISLSSGVNRCAREAMRCNSGSNPVSGWAGADSFGVGCAAFCGEEVEAERVLFERSLVSRRCCLPARSDCSACVLFALSASAANTSAGIFEESSDFIWGTIVFLIALHRR